MQTNFTWHSVIFKYNFLYEKKYIRSSFAKGVEPDFIFNIPK